MLFGIRTSILYSALRCFGVGIGEYSGVTALATLDTFSSERLFKFRGSRMFPPRRNFLASLPGLFQRLVGVTEVTDLQWPSENEYDLLRMGKKLLLPAPELFPPEDRLDPELLVDDELNDKLDDDVDDVDEDEFGPGPKRYCFEDFMPLYL